MYDFVGGASVKLDTGSGGVSKRRWYHVAIVRSGSTITGYLNGVSFGTHTSSNNYSGTDCSIGSLENNAEHMNGYISNFRIVAGTAVYSSNFTPPTTPLTNITNTKILCCQSTTSATAAVVTPNTITTGGQAIADISQNPFDAFSVDGIGYSTAATATAATTSNLTAGNITFLTRFKYLCSVN